MTHTVTSTSHNFFFKSDLYLLQYIYIYIYIERERDRDRQTDWDSDSQADRQVESIGEKAYVNKLNHFFQMLQQSLRNLHGWRHTKEVIMFLDYCCQNSLSYSEKS